MESSQLERALTAAGLMVLLLVCIKGRVPPPAIIGSEHPLQLRPNEEPVELEFAPGRFLRGSFKPTYPGAPVVMHLSEADSRWLDLGGFFRAHLTGSGRFADLGFASLVIDYTGIGPSDGRAAVGNLGRDARLIWDEAVRRAGGDPGRVVIHGTSLGTLAASQLLLEGARPAGVILAAPVLHDTAVRRGARVLAGPLADLASAWLFTSLGQVDLRDLEPAGLDSMPLLIFAGSSDRFVSEAEREELERCTKALGGTWVERDVDHLHACRLGRALGPEGIRFLRGLDLAHPPSEPRLSQILTRLPTDVARRFHSDSAAFERLCEEARYGSSSLPLTLAASAWTAQGDTALRMRWLKPFPTPPRIGWGRGLGLTYEFDHLVALYDLTDPAGPLPIGYLEQCGLANSRGVYEVGAIEHAVARRGAKFGVISGSGPFELDQDFSQLWGQLGGEGLPEADRRRRFARLLLKFHEIPDRVAPGADGEPVLEVLDAFTWRPFDFGAEPWPEPGAGQ